MPNTTASNSIKLQMTSRSGHTTSFCLAFITLIFLLPQTAEGRPPPALGMTFPGISARAGSCTWWSQSSCPSCFGRAMHREETFLYVGKILFFQARPGHAPATTCFRSSRGGSWSITQSQTDALPTAEIRQRLALLRGDFHGRVPNTQQEGLKWREEPCH